MANEEVLGPRKTMFVLVIVVGCFAVLWPRILSPLILGHTREQLKPNQFDREAGCCEMIFEKEVALLELLNEVCSSIVHVDGKLSPYAAAECRKTVNDTCGVDIAAFIKRDENVGKTTRKLLETMKNSNSSCLKEHFGLPQWTIANHVAFNSWTLQDTVKQERPPMRTGPHPALRERGRAIPPGTPPPTRGPIAMPPHMRVRSSPLDVYFEIDIKPPPIPGMRPPLGSPGGPVPTPKSSMGFVMPIYTICIIVFFVYTLSKILFKRTGPSTYESVAPDPQFRRRVFRDDSRTTPDKLGHKERDTIVTAISGLVAEVQQQMEASYAQNQQRQDLQDNHARPYTNGTVLHNTGPVHIVASEYRDKSKEKSPGPAKESSPESKVPEPQESTPEPKLSSPEPLESLPEEKELSPEPTVEKESTPEPTVEKELSPEPLPVEKESTPKPEKVESTPEIKETVKPEQKDDAEDSKETSPEPIELLEPDFDEPKPKQEQISQNGTAEPKETETEEKVEINHSAANTDLIKLTENLESVNRDTIAELVEDFINEAKAEAESQLPKQSTPELLEEALKEDSPEKDLEDEEEKGTVKVVGMEVTAHAADGRVWRPAPVPTAPAPRPHVAEEVKAIYLEGEIPQQSRVLVAEFEDHAQEKPPTKHSPMVVSGKMTLSLIQDAPRETPDRDLESTVDDFTTASGITQPAEKEEELSDEEVEEEIEVEEIEEEVSEEEVEEQEDELKKPAPAPANAAT